MKKHHNVVKQSRRLNKEHIKKQLLDSFAYNENITKKDLSARVDTVEDCQRAMEIIKEYENLIKTNKKNIILFAYEQGNFLKNLKRTENLKILLNNSK